MLFSILDNLISPDIPRLFSWLSTSSKDRSRKEDIDTKEYKEEANEIGEKLWEHHHNNAKYEWKKSKKLHKKTVILKESGNIQTGYKEHKAKENNKSDSMEDSLYFREVLLPVRNIWEYRIECSRHYSSPIKCGKWEYIDDSKIDREERNGDKDYAHRDIVLDDRDEGRPQSNWSSEHILGLSAFLFTTRGE